VNCTEGEARDARLSVLALVRAYASRDAEGFRSLLRHAGPGELEAITVACVTSLADLLARYEITLAALEDDDTRHWVTTACYDTITSTPGVPAMVDSHIAALQARTISSD
jgi:hypothetical protein